MDTQTHDLGTRTSDHVDSEFTASQAHESNVAQEIVAQRMLAIPPTARARIREAPIGADAAVAVASHDPTRTAAAAARTVQVPLPMDFDRAASKRPRNPLPSFDPECASETLRAALRQKIQQIEEAEKKEAGEYREFEQEMQQRAKANMGSTAATSLEEMGPEERKFVTTLINGVKNKSTNDTTFHGIMRSHNLIGQLNCPLTHQRNVVRRIASASTTMYLVAHGMGLGKTATALMAICAEACMLGRMPKVIISVPSATLDQWQDSVADWMRIDFKRVLCTSTLSKINESVMEQKDIFILSRDTVARAYGSCFQKYEKHHQIQTGPGLRWVSQWDRIGVFEGPNAMAPLHPIFEPPHNEALGWEGYWDMMIVDEVCFVTRAVTPRTHIYVNDCPFPLQVHYCRNPDSRWCESHAELAHVATKRIGLSGTAVINRGGDLGGIAKALKSASKFQRKGAFTKNHNHKTIDRDMVREFTNEKQFHRATADILQLPPIEREAINYDVRMPLEHVAKYNSKLTDARNLKMRIERAGGKASGQDLKRLMALLQVMQQYVVSPVLGEEGAATFREQQELYDKASSNENATGAFYALRDEIKALRAQGHRRIVVAANHTTIMKIVRRWLERNNPEFGTIYVYDGELSVKGRLNVKRGFLQSDKGLLFLSVGAGGVGLHLVPGCESMVRGIFSKHSHFHTN
tara:strand:- start:457 stop:2529 length:2073 start_codon:yes stop_codon:yes gene_type:complete